MSEISQSSQIHCGMRIKKFCMKMSFRALVWEFVEQKNQKTFEVENFEIVIFWKKSFHFIKWIYTKMGWRKISRW